MTNLARMLFLSAVLLQAILMPVLQAAEDDLKLWYKQPAGSWLQALPVGNGRLGAMVHGGFDRELLQLNEDTIWSGNRSDYDRAGAYRYLPEIRRLLFQGNYRQANEFAAREILGDRPPGAYQPLGDLVIDFCDSKGSVTDYRRELDLDSAVARVTFRRDGVLFTREIFCSAPANVLVVRLASSEPKGISVLIELSRKEGAQSRNLGSDGILLEGQADQAQPTAGTKFIGLLKAMPEGGSVTFTNGALKIDSADSVILLLSAATDYRNSGDIFSVASLPLELASKKSFTTLLKEHLAEHQRLFRRAALSLGLDNAAPVPTDTRLKLVKQGQDDPGLAALYFQYGRYLMISSSRPGDLAANLQGIWNDNYQPPWFCGYHFDVNAQMNYWIADVANLSECNEPFFDMIDVLRVNGRKTAKEVYNCRGFVVSHRTNGRMFTSPVKGLNVWPVGAAWLCQHLWEHYRFVQDKDFLRTRAYPAMRESAEFFLDWLVVDPKTGKLVSGPSISPENTFEVPDGSMHNLCMGPAMDQQIITELFDNCLAAARVLKMNDSFIKEVRAKRARLAGPQIGSDGRLMEWSKEYREREPEHRHYSHLYALYPGWQITPRDTPALARAARKSLEYRLRPGTSKVNISNSSNVGWSLAWTIGLWARLGDAEGAHEAFSTLMRNCIFPNLFDGHPQAKTEGVFQIDGNLGAAAGIAEMLVQSHTGQIELLPALPSKWSVGSAHGLRARGGFEVDLDWKDGKLTRAVLHPLAGGRVVVCYRNKSVSMKLKRNETVALEADLKRAREN